MDLRRVRGLLDDVYSRRLQNVCENQFSQLDSDNASSGIAAMFWQFLAARLNPYVTTTDRGVEKTLVVFSDYAIIYRPLPYLEYHREATSPFVLGLVSPNLQSIRVIEDDFEFCVAWPLASILGTIIYHWLGGKVEHLSESEVESSVQSLLCGVVETLDRSKLWQPINHHFSRLLFPYAHLWSVFRQLDPEMRLSSSEAHYVGRSLPQVSSDRSSRTFYALTPLEVMDRNLREQVHACLFAGNVPVAGRAAISAMFVSLLSESGGGRTGKRVLLKLDHWRMRRAVRRGVGAEIWADLSILSSIGLTLPDLTVELLISRLSPLSRISPSVLRVLSVELARREAEHPGFILSAFDRRLDGPWEEHFADTIDWLLAETPSPDANQRKDGWEWLQRKQIEWHERIAIEARERQQQVGLVKGSASTLSWTSLVDQMIVDEYLVVPLTSEMLLKDEGIVMRHCVGGYAWVCANTECRIFSIRSGDVRHATFTIERNLSRDGWELTQIRGHSNSRVLARYRGIANKVAKLYVESPTHADRQ